MTTNLKERLYLNRKPVNNYKVRRMRKSTDPTAQGKRRGLSKGENIIHFLSPYTPVLDPDEFRGIENPRKHRTSEKLVDTDNIFNKTIAMRKGVVAYKYDDKNDL